MRVQDEEEHFRSEPRLQRRLQEAEEMLKESYDEIRALQQVVQSQKEEVNNLRLSLHDSRSAQSPQMELRENNDNIQTDLAENITGAKQEISDLRKQWHERGNTWAETRRELVQTFENKERSWQQQISKLQQIVEERDQRISRAEQEQRTQNGVHRSTLALLSCTQAELKQQQQECARLKNEYSQKLADQEKRHQAELNRREDNHQNELAEKVVEATKELAGLQKEWEGKEEAWCETRRKLEETLQQNDNILKKEISQLRELAAERDQQISRVQHEQATQKVANMETLALLSSTEAALRHQEEEYAGLKDQHSLQLADLELRHQTELSNAKENFQSVIAGKIMENKQALVDLQEQWGAKEEAWCEMRRKLEETILKNENIWNEKETTHMEEIQLLRDGMAELQVSHLNLCWLCF